MSNRRPDYFEQERVTMTLEVPSTAASLTLKLWKIPAGRKFAVERVSYINPTGLTGASGNAFAGALKNGSTTMATLFNTDTGAGGATLAADTFVEGTLSGTATAQWGAAADVLSLVLTKTGTQTLPAGRLVIEGRLY